MTSDQHAARPWLDHLRRPSSLGDLAIVVTVSLVAISLLHVYFATGFNTATTLVVLGALDPMRSLQATIVVVVPTMFVGATVCYVPRYVVANRRSDWTIDRVVGILMCALYALAVLVTSIPVPILVLLLLFSVWLASIEYFSHRRATGDPSGPHAPMPSLGVVLPVSLLSVILLQPCDSSSPRFCAAVCRLLMGSVA